MSEFEPAVNYVLAQEGGLSENPNDSGGITNFGISLRFLRTIEPERLRRYGIFEEVNEETIRGLVLDQAKFIYRGEFWDEAPFQEIECQKVCTYLFDMCVNLGVSQAVKLLQRSICAASHDRSLCRDDGLLGVGTIGYVNYFGEQLVPILMGLRAEFYRALVAAHPHQSVNLKGWLNRCYAS